MSLSNLSTIYGSTENAFVWGMLKLKSPENECAKEYLLHGKTVCIGTDPSINDVVIQTDHPSTGKYHCILSEEYGSVVVRTVPEHTTIILRRDQTSIEVPEEGACILNCGDAIILGWGCFSPELELVEHLSEGGVWNKYIRRSDELGFGCGTVYKAEDPFSLSPPTFYAVKSIRVHHAHRLEYAQREVENLKLKHPNICEFIEVVMENNRIDIVMEYVDGPDLFTCSQEMFCTLSIQPIDYISSYKQFQRELNYQLCQAVKFIHSKGIIHRNIKPDNILVTSGAHPVIKIIDFGVSKLLNRYDANLTMQCGTTNYMAPEITSTTRYDNKVDCYSVGQTVIDCFFLLNDKGKHVRDLDFLETKYGEEVSSFVRNLIQDSPEERMSMSEALDHRWMRDYVPFHDFPEYKAIDKVSTGQIPLTPNKNHKLASILEEDNDESLSSNMVISPVRRAPEYSLTTKSPSNTRKLVRTTTQRILVKEPSSSDRTPLSPTRTPKSKVRHHPFVGESSTARSRGPVDEA